MHILRRAPWQVPTKELTSERAWLDRRSFLAGLGAIGLVGCPAGAFAKNPNTTGPGKDLPLTEPYSELDGRPGFPATPNPDFQIRRKTTEPYTAMSHNNFYEFTTAKNQVWKAVEDFEPRPWQLEVTGEVDNPLKLDVDDLAKIGYEERTYRFRCVEAWAMVVPWIGLPLHKLLKLAKPKNDAKYVKFVSFKQPSVAKGQRTGRQFKWPYYEGLRMKEAMHELTLLATGIYGLALPRQHGAPVRLVTPWKYGFKSIKSITRIEVTRGQPATFWNDLQPREYAFEANVNPMLPHPRWSQAKERMIGTGAVHRTDWLNGYGELLGDLYKTQPWAPGWDTKPTPF